jgi:hypothetical protein
MNAARRPARKPGSMAQTPRDLAGLYVALLDRLGGDGGAPLTARALRSNVRAVLLDAALGRSGAPGVRREIVSVSCEDPEAVEAS